MLRFARHVGAADHAAHAGRALRGRRVDPADARMVVRAAQHLEVQEACDLVVVEVGGRAGDVAEHVLALRRLADLVEIVVALVGEVFLAELQHGSLPQARRAPWTAPAAARTALMMGS